MDESAEKILPNFACKVKEIAIATVRNKKFVIDPTKVNNFKFQFKTRWLKSNRTKKTFLEGYDSWLNSKVKLFRVPPIAGSSSFDVKQSESSKRRKTAQLRGGHSTDELTYAAQMKLRQEGKLVQS